MYAHLLVGNAGFASPVSVTPPSGWTLITASTLFAGNLSPDNFIVKGYVYRKVAGGSEPANYTWSHASASAEMFLKNWTGVDNTTPEDIALVENSSLAVGAGSGQTVTLGFGSSVTNGAQVCAFDTAWDAPGAGSYSGTTPTLTTDFTGSLAKTATGNLATAGAIGSRTRTNGNGSAGNDTGWYAAGYVIRPSSGAAAASMLPLNPMQQMLNQLLAR